MTIDLGRRLELLRRAPAFRLLLLASVGSWIGTWLAFVALTVDVWDQTHSSVWVAALLAADFLPTVAVGLLLGPLVDRLSRKRVLVVSDLARCVVFAALPFAGSPGAIVAVAAIAGFATGFFRPAAYAGMPNLVSEDDLAQANSLLLAAENLAWMVTPPLAGVFVALWGPDPGYVVNAVSFAFSAALIARIPASLLQRAKAASEGHVHDLLAGFSVVWRTRALLAVFVAWNVLIVSSAFVNVAEISFAKDTLGSGDFGFGLLIGASGLGLVVGSYFAAGLVERRPIGAVYAASIAAMALALIAGAVSPVLLLLAAFMVFLGVGNGIAVVCNALMVQRGAPDEFRGRAFTIIMSTNYAVLGVAMAAAGLVTDAYGARWAFGIAAGFAAAAAVLGFMLVPRAEAAPRAAIESLPSERPA